MSLAEQYSATLGQSIREVQRPTRWYLNRHVIERIRWAIVRRLREAGFTVEWMPWFD